MRVSNCPAGPTNGSPTVSSSAPGASPQKNILASRLPTPSTIFFPGCTCFRQTGSLNTISRSAAQRVALSPAGNLISAGALGITGDSGAAGAAAGGEARGTLADAIVGVAGIRGVEIAGAIA